LKVKAMKDKTNQWGRRWWGPGRGWWRRERGPQIQRNRGHDLYGERWNEDPKAEPPKPQNLVLLWCV